MIRLQRVALQRVARPSVRCVAQQGLIRQSRSIAGSAVRRDEKDEKREEEGGHDRDGSSASNLQGDNSEVRQEGTNRPVENDQGQSEIAVGSTLRARHGAEEGTSSKADTPMERNAEMNVPRDGSVSSGSRSALDEIFEGPDAFARNDDVSSRRPQTRNTSKQSATLPRDILGDAFTGEEYTSQLNQEWEKKDSKWRNGNESSAPFYDARSAYRERNSSPRRAEYQGFMTQEEQNTFTKVFDQIFSEDGKRSKDERLLRDDDGSFGSTLEDASNELLHDYRNRTMRNWDGRNRKLEHRRWGMSAFLQEGITAESVNEDELEEKIDQAREEMYACQTVADLWLWAAKNVWGADRERELLAQAARGEEEEATEEKNVSEGLESAEADREQEAIDAGESKTSDGMGGISTRVEEPANVRFGIMTPYYAPVLSLLLVQLRERFRSPHSALSVLRIAKNLGPDSFVLGCTPQMYAQALRTRWMILRDLQGSRDTLQEARDTGILGSQTILSAAWESRVTPRQGKPKETEEDNVRNVVSKTIKIDVRQHVLDGMARLKHGQTSQAYEHQLNLVKQMDRMIGKTFVRRAQSSRAVPAKQAY